MSANGSTTATFQNHNGLPIAIVGGGLGGAALAIGLLKHGVKVHIYEASQAFAEIGAGVGFGANATTALHLIDPRLLEGYMKHATINTDPERENTFNTIRWGMDERRPNGAKAGDLGFHQADAKKTPDAPTGFCMRGRIHRARLLDEMVALLPKDITSFGKSFQSVEEVGAGMLKISFADGTTTLASALIGCDGIKSKVRSFVCGPDVKPAYAHEGAIRAMAPAEVVKKALGEERALNGTLYCGYGGSCITYPVDHGELINMVAMPHDRSLTSTWDQDDWIVPTSADEVREKFKDFYPPLIDLIARHTLPSKWALHTLRHDKPYFKGRVCLLGDSAHATTPHMGAGAGMAMEDAFLLSRLIADVGSSDNIEAAFKAYDAVRRPRTQGCIQRSIENGLAYNFMVEGVEDDMNKLEQKLNENFRWLWYENLEEQLRRAQKVLKETSGHDVSQL